MDKELATIEKNSTQEIVYQPKGKYIIGIKWVYKTKYRKDDSI